jgi:nickel/cobalt exporter
MGKAEEKEKLKILLNHWIEHNREHTQEFAEWAEKAKSFGQATVHDDIMQAVQQMNRVNELLLKASERLKEG